MLPRCHLKAERACVIDFDIRLSEVAWLICFNLLVFQSSLKTWFPLAGYFDEGATICMLMAAISASFGRVSVCEHRLSSVELLSLVFLAALVFIGLLGNFQSRIQLDAKPILIDVFACIKFVLLYLSGIVVMRGKRRLYEVVIIEIKFLLLMMVPFAALNQFMDLGMRFDFRNGLHSFQFIFIHPGTYAEILAGFVLLLMVESEKNRGWIVLSLVLIVLSLRSTAIAFVACVVILCLNGTNKSARLGQLGLIILAAIYLGWNQIQYYYLVTDGSARAMLTSVSLDLAGRYAPIGSGFATFASNITAQPGYYSLLYYQYGLNVVNGLVPGDISFLSDTFWPIIIGQFGWLGLISFLSCIAVLFFGRLRFNSKRAVSGKLVILFFAYLLLASLGSTAFFHPASALFTISFAIANAEQLARASACDR